MKNRNIKTDDALRMMKKIGGSGSNHNHDTIYSKLGHTHTNYVDLTTAQTVTSTKTFDGEQKYINSSYCATITDTASGVGCAFKASRGLFNEMLVDKLIMTATAGQLPIYAYTGTSGGQMSDLTKIAHFTPSGDLGCKGIVVSGTVSTANLSVSGNTSLQATGVKSLAVNNVVMNDFVVEQGTSNGWYYQKWNSGKAECYKTVTQNVTSWSAWGNLYEGMPKVDAQTVAQVLRHASNLFGA